MELSDKIASLTRRDPLSFGISYIDLLEGKLWEVSTRAWATEIYQTANPWLVEKYPTGYPRRVVVTKSTQAGISTWAMVKMFHLAVNWPVRIFYTLPRQQDLLDLVSTRVDPMIRSSKFLLGKLGNPDSAHSKRISDSYLFFMELTTEPRMMPADLLIVDEVDLSDQDNMATAINRLDASRWKLTSYLSTPTVPNFGVHGLYINSDMRQWMVKCEKCGQEQPLDWDANLRVIGAANNPDRVFYGCIRCNEEITVEHVQTGRWVAQHPERSLDLVGFHVHQMLTTPANTLYRIFRDPTTRLIEFYRKRLGKPYEVGGGSIERDDFLATCFDDPYEYEAAWDGKSAYYMGVDQGNELQVIISKIPPNSNRPKVVHVELIPMIRGFERLSQLIEIFHIRKGVGDANPNRHGMIAQVRRFPGRFLVADYIEQREVWKVKAGLSDLPKVKTNVTIDRTTGFDTLMEEIKAGKWQLPGEPPALHPDTELVIDHLTSLKRDVETRRTQSGETQIGVWRKLRSDHFAHSWLYMLTAIKIDRGRNYRIAVIGRSDDDEQDAVETDEYRPSPGCDRQGDRSAGGSPRRAAATGTSATARKVDHRSRSRSGTSSRSQGRISARRTSSGLHKCLHPRRRA